jgi:hypothetical protein
VTAKKKAKTKSKKDKKESRLGGFARAFDVAGRDADLARRAASDPEFRRRLQADRRGTLSGFRAVRDALADRERIEKKKKD